MFQITYERLDRSRNKLKCMPPHQVALGAAGGSVSTLLLGILRGLLAEDRLPPIDCLCPDINLDFSEHTCILYFIAGLGVGVLLGPLVDLLWLLREKWRRFVISRLLGEQLQTSRSLYKVLA